MFGVSPLNELISSSSFVMIMLGVLKTLCIKLSANPSGVLTL